MPNYPRTTVECKHWLICVFSAQLEAIFTQIEQADAEASCRFIELRVWGLLMVVGRALLAALLSRRCWQITQAYLGKHDLGVDEIEFVGKGEGELTVKTTVGEIDVAGFAYRSRRNSGSVQKPARETLFPLLPGCQSSELLLEWETRLGMEHPFRLAQEELTFFSHGAVAVADNTIARHVVKAAAALDPSMLYLDPKDIRQTLQTNATLDVDSQRPVLYASSDAHALRRYASDTWHTPWKMANGIRLWCIDKDTGKTIHLGGEFTWGDCHEVRRIFERLIKQGILRCDGDYGNGVVAKIVWLSDGMPWFEDHVLPLFHESAIEVVLDVYHLLDRLADCANSVFADDEGMRRRWYSNVAFELTGKRPSKQSKARVRKGHKKRSPATIQKTDQSSSQTDTEQKLRDIGPDETAMLVLKHLSEAEKYACDDAKRTAIAKMFNYVAENAYRINFTRYRLQGLQIGSGAMESLNRSGSQQRMKRPGTRWLAETAQALLNWRMLRIVGRWNEFWNGRGIASKIAEHWGRPVITYPLPMEAPVPA